MTPTIWVTPNKNSQVVCSAIHRATGFPMRQVHEAEPIPGPSIVYGLLRGCSEIIQRCEASSTDYWHIDHGYFKRSAPEKFDGYYRITRNGLSVRPMPERFETHTRFADLRIPLSKMREEGDVVMICPPTIPVAAHFGLKPMEWVERISYEVKSHGKTPLLRLKSSAEPTAQAIARSAEVIAYNSNIAVDALVAGVPARQEQGPVRPDVDRISLLDWLANNQWRLDEVTPEIFA